MKTFHILTRVVSLVACLFVATLMSAQGRIAGIVTDDSGETLIGANVIVQGTTEGTVTDFDGTFSFNTSQSFPLTLVASYTGYATQEIEVSGPTENLTITLSEGVLLGDDVVISASRKREKVQEAPASISVLTARKLEGTANPTDATRNLVNTAGVQIQQQSANRINISMRGGAGLFGTSVFPIMDYRSLIGPGIGSFQSDQAGISNLDLARIEVVRGPGSALYGPGVTQGVVHFITKNPIDYPGTSVDLTGGELNTFGATIRHATKVSDKFGFKINAQYRRGDEFTLDGSEGTYNSGGIFTRQIDKFVPQFVDLTTGQPVPRGIYQPDLTSEGYVNQFSAGKLLIPAADLDPDADGNLMQDDWYNTSINATFEFRPKDNLSLTFSGGHNQASSVFYNEQGEGLSQAKEFWGQGRMQLGGLFAQIFYVANDGGTEDNPSFLYQTGLRTPVGRTQLETQLQYNFGTPKFLNADWTTGIDYRSAGQDTEGLVYGRNEDDDDFSVVGGYLQGKFKLSDKLDFVAAGRYDRFNFIDQGAFAPRAAFVFKPSPQHTFRASFNRANTTVSNLQLNIDFPLTNIIPGSFDVWLTGNKQAQVFDDNPMIDWFTSAIPSVPVGTPGMPIAVFLAQEVAPGVTVNDAVIGGYLQALAADPSTAPLIPILQPILGAMDISTLGFAGNLSQGFNIFDNTPLGVIDAPISTIETHDTYEVGYKGLIGGKIGVSLDIYRMKQKNNSQFTAISPAYVFSGVAGIPGEVGAAVQGSVQSQIQAALMSQAGMDAATAAGTAAALSGALNSAYSGATGAVLNTPSPAFGGATLAQVFGALPFHGTTQTQQSPNNGITHLSAGYRTFDERTFWGSDLGLEYFINDNVTTYFNYSWVNKNQFLQKVVGNEAAGELPTYLNIPKNKYRAGLILTPEYGLRANIAFQHDDSYVASAGQYSSDNPTTPDIVEETDPRNLVDIGVGYKFDNGLSVDLTATNLFDNQYRYLPNMPKIGRRVLGKIRYDFGAEGPSDIDGDGIKDKKDACPNEPGLKEFQGCADTDGDGIVDKDDKCPNAAGDILYGGCPDSDGDGVIDQDDDCPNSAGTLGGCPDADGDGVADKDDNCPNSAGTLGGCPDGDGDGVADKDDNCPNASGSVGGCPDGDGDGVADKDDKCPDTAARTADGCPADPDGDGVAGDADKCPNAGGIVDENGCPKDSDGDGVADNDDKCPNMGGVVGPDGCKREVPSSATSTFVRAMQEVKFESGRGVITKASYGVLDEVAAIMAEYPGLKIDIEGHTDSQGNDDNNMKLSQKRAEAVQAYLLGKGVPVARMRALGYGETRPIADNGTRAGRAENRRVAFVGYF